MSSRTRYFVIASLLVLVVGVGTGLVAYYNGIPGIFSRQDGLDGTLSLVPPNVNLVAYANVREVMASEVRDRVRKLIPAAGDGQREIAELTGINIDTDVDEVVAYLAPPTSDGRLPASGLVIARGRFDQPRLEGLMRQHGATAEDYKGTSVFIPPPSGPSVGVSHETFGVAFLEPGLAVLGNLTHIHAAVDRKNAGGQDITANAELMKMLRSIDRGNAWAVGRFDALAEQTPLPNGLASQLPPLTWVAVNVQLDGGIQGTLRADARDEQAAKDLREVVRGFVALARLEIGSNPNFKLVADSLVIGGSGNTVSLAFNVPSTLLDGLTQLERMPQASPDFPRK